MLYLSYGGRYGPALGARIPCELEARVITAGDGVATRNLECRCRVGACRTTPTRLHLYHAAIGCASNSPQSGGVIHRVRLSIHHGPLIPKRSKLLQVCLEGLR